jgi:hypothetical protein
MTYSGIFLMQIQAWIKKENGISIMGWRASIYIIPRCNCTGIDQSTRCREKG